MASTYDHDTRFAGNVRKSFQLNDSIGKPVRVAIAGWRRPCCTSNIFNIHYAEINEVVWKGQTNINGPLFFIPRHYAYFFPWFILYGYISFFFIKKILLTLRLIYESPDNKETFWRTVAHNTFGVYEQYFYKGKL